MVRMDTKILSMDKPLKPISMKSSLGLSVIAQLALCAALASLQFGINVSVLNTSKAFITIDLGWCKGESHSLSCRTGQIYGMIIGSAMFLSATAGCIVAMKLVDHGRRYALIVNHLVFMLGGLLSGTAEGFMTLFVARLIIGLSVGISTVAPCKYISEMAPKKSRGYYGTFHQLFIVLGLLIAGMLGLAFGEAPHDISGETVSDFQSFWWRFMVGCPFIFSLFGLLAILCLYPSETPVYLYNRGERLEAYRVLACIISNGRHCPVELPAQDDMSDSAEAYRELERTAGTEKMSQEKLSLLEAIRIPIYRKIIFIAVALAVGQQLTGINALMANSNALYRAINLSPSILTVITVCMYIFNVILTFPSLYLIERWGRKKLLLVGNIGQSVFLIGGAIALFIGPDSRICQILGIVGTYGYIFFFAMAYGPVLWVYLFECCPPQIQSVGPALASASSWISAFGVVLLSDLLVQLGTGVVLAIFGIASVLVSVFVFFVVKETKGLPIGQSPYMPLGIPLKSTDYA